MAKNSSRREDEPSGYIEKSFPGRKNKKCEHPEELSSLVYSKSRKVGQNDRKRRRKGTLVGDQVTVARIFAFTVKYIKRHLGVLHR